MAHAITRTVPPYRLILMLILVLAAMLPVLSIQPVAADEVFEVNSTADDPDDDLTDGVCLTAAGECTLRAALQQANNLSDGLINLTITVYQPGQYVLTDQLAVYGQNIFIYGTGNPGDVVIDGNDIYRVFDIAAGASVEMYWLTLRGGKNMNSVVVPGHYHGGAIHNHGEMTLGNVVIVDSGVVVAEDPPIEPQNCVLHCGGAIYNANTANLYNVALVNNSAVLHGGAIANAGSLIAENVTFSDNSTTNGDGAALYNTGTATLTNATVANNTTAAGAAIFNDVAGTLTLGSSIIANNTGGNCSGAITDALNNISYPDATCPGLVEDPLLDPGGAQNNGGGTLTIYLLSASPAIDLSAAPCTLATDQRGVARPQQAGCDSGAVEVQALLQACLYAGALSRVGTLEDGVTSDLGCGRGTPIVLVEGSDYFACLYAGALSQFGTVPPTNCGRGVEVGYAAGTDYHACLFSGALSQVGTSIPVNCGRGAPIGLAGVILD